ncbi:MAG: lytic murein transglycosylase [Gammaproteobacteria bacterium]|jgi:membrane-bound lytic murein transglycosylase B|nr:lytic murein transglycosylase [Gammaproteobacteria bacterium]MBU0828762.1 lytic murein transglycosylase [Gammaproteobacteria bacterium]MBU0891799.1 lytic murein transglycosylase [Gammaproteobacteria bacterium]MBU1817561.1 lytic murein transglycosylase [Gammaproteobacteria bacterium]
MQTRPLYPLSAPSFHLSTPWWLALVTAIAVSGCASATPPDATPRPAPRPGLQPTAVPATTAPTSPTAPTVSSAATAATPTTSNTESAEQAAFVAWRDQFSAQALAANIRPETVRTVLGNAQLLTRVVDLDRAQPEFTRTPWAYLDSAVSAQRIAQGQAKRAEHQAALDAAAARYGVPAPIITAIWGMESNYGSNFGSFRAVDALATLAFEGRRRSWAQTELLAVLRIVDQGDIAADRMIGSWAGAMGHTQFLPSVFLTYAVDADGDGHRDIWGSIPDVTASTAHFLSRMGWQSGQPWGVEVQLPPGFDYARAELTIRQNATAWAAEGVRALDGQALPELGEASVITPAGARGPAFLVGPNFRTILRYNNSVNYALGVSLLARQIDGGAPIATAWPRDIEPLHRDQLRQLQTALNSKGFDAGTPDGVMGPATRAGLRRFQQSIGAVADGYPTAALLERLQAAQ